MYYLKADITSPIHFISAGHFSADNSWIHSERVITDYEIIINLKNPIYMKQEEELFTLNAGDCLLLLPGLVHKGVDYSDRGTSFYWFHFYFDQQSEGTVQDSSINQAAANSAHTVISAEEADASILLLHNNNFFEGLSDICLLPAVMRGVNLNRISILFHQLLHLLSSSYYTELATRYLLTSLLIELTQQNITQLKQKHQDEPSSNKLPKILEWIRIHSLQNISLADVSHEFSYSREYLARYFKKHMGMTMQQYIYNLKLSKAKELLCESDKTVREIAETLGFQDEKYFMKLFKRMEDTTPRQYRNAYNRTHMNTN